MNDPVITYWNMINAAAVANNEAIPAEQHVLHYVGNGGTFYFTVEDMDQHVARYGEMLEDLRKLLEIARENTEECRVYAKFDSDGNLNRHYLKQLDFIDKLEQKYKQGGE